MPLPIGPADAAELHLLALDFDGILTDGTVTLSSDAGLSKTVSYHDIVGITRWRRLGRLVVIISGEDSPMLQKYADYYKIHRLHAACKDKAAALSEIVSDYQLDFRNVAYMGDDVMDLCAMRLAKLKATVPTAHPMVLAEAQWISSCPAGRGAVRELIDELLALQGVDPTDLGKRPPSDVSVS